MAGRIARLRRFRSKTRAVIVAAFVAVAVSSLCDVASAAGPLGGIGGNPAESPLVVSGVDVFLGGEQFANAAAAERESPTAIDARAASRNRYVRLNAHQAASLVGRSFPDVVEQVAVAPQLLPGDHLMGFANAHTARIKLTNGRGALIESAAPMALQTGPHRWAPVNLNLREEDGAFSPETPVVAVTMPRRLGEGLALPGAGITVTPVSPEDTSLAGGAPMIDGAGVLYPNTAENADTLAKPLPDGLEVSTVLRASSSPQQLDYKLTLAQGDRLSQAPGSGQAIIITRGHRIVAVVEPPTAVDAAGTAVPLTMSLARQTVRINIPHRAGSYLYPILVDPQIVETGAEGAWHFHQAGGYNESRFFMKHTGAYPIGDYAEWSIQAPGYTKIFAFAAQSSFEHANINHEEQDWPISSVGAAFMAISGPGEFHEKPLTAVSETAPEVCANPECGMSGVASNNAAIWEVTTTKSGTAEEISATLNEPKVYLGQEAGLHTTATTDHAAELEYTLEGKVIKTPNAFAAGHPNWIGPNSGAFEITTNDGGLGVYEQKLVLFEGGKYAEEGVGYGDQEFSKTSSCVGLECAPTQKYIGTYQKTRGNGGNVLPEGERWMRMRARSAMPETVSTEYEDEEQILKVDAKRPYNLSFTGLPTIKEKRVENGKEQEVTIYQLGENQPRVKVEATDGEGTTPASGIAKLAIGVDGREIGASGGSCEAPSGPCTASNEWALNGAELGAGEHTLTVTATDRAGNIEATNYHLAIYHAQPIPLGPGSINPQSGDFALENADVSLSGNMEVLSVTRHLDSRNTTEGEEGALGPEWTISLGQLAQLEVEPDGSVLVFGPEGLAYFTKTKSGAFEAPEGDENLTVEYVEAKKAYLVADPAQGTVTQFTEPAGAEIFLPTVSEGPVATDKVTDEYRTVEVGGATIVQPTLELAPHPSANCERGKLERGCRALEFVYDESTTAKGEAETEWGGYKGRLKEVIAVAYSPEAKEMKKTPAAAYEYDVQGRLRAEWNPSISPALRTTYGYDETNELTAIDPPGQQPEVLVYGTTAGDPSSGRVVRYLRPPAATPLTKPTPIQSAGNTLTGTAARGATLTATPGAWKNNPLTYSYQWETCPNQCEPITGATNPNYTVTEGDVGHTLRVKLTGTNSDGSASQYLTTIPKILETPQEFGVTHAAPGPVMLGPDKNIWWGNASGFIGKMTPSGTFAEYPTGSSRIVSLVAGSDGNIWFTTATGQLGKMTPAGSVTYVTLPKSAAAWKVTAGPDGNLWFTDPGLNKIGKVTTAGTVTEYPVGNRSLGPESITTGPDHNLWFTCQSVNGTGSVGKITPAGVVTEYLIGELHHPNEITSGPDGNLWYISEASFGGATRIGKITTAGTGNAEYALPAGSQPGSLTSGPEGEPGLWFTDPALNQLDHITTSGKVIAYPALPAGSKPVGITVGYEGDVWFAESGTAKIAKSDPTPANPTPRAPEPGATLYYNLPVSGGSAPEPMGQSEVEVWGQKDLPRSAAAIIPASTSPMGWPATDYKRAILRYQDAQARTVNVANPSGGISTTEYSKESEVTRTLSPANRAKALLEPNPAEAAGLLSTTKVYNEGALTETKGPQHLVKLQEDGGATTLARRRVRYYYDEGAPESEPYNLVTKTIAGAELAGGQEYDKHVVTTSYSGQSNLGWELREPTSVTVDPGGLNLTSTTKYDKATGNVIETQAPAATGGDVHVPPAFSSVFGKAGTSNGELKEPRAEAVVGSNIMVLDSGNSRIEEYSPTGGYLTAFGGFGKENGQLENPYAMVADSSGNLYVADSTNNRVEIFNASHHYSAQFGTEGTAAGQFKEPKGIARTGSGTIWVTDANNNRIEKFNEKDEFQLAIGWGVSNGEAKFQICTTGCRAGLSGTGAGEFKEPRGLAVTPSGNIWIADYGNNRTQEFNEKGEFQRAIGWGVSNGEVLFENCTTGCRAGLGGAGAGQFNQPKTVAIDPTTGNLWVADATNNRLEEFSSTGSYLATAGGKGTGNGQFEESGGIAFSSTGMWIADVKNNRIQKWVPTYTGATGAHDTKTIYYTAGAEAEVPECRNHIEWVGLPCEKAPVAQPGSGLPELPIVITEYNMWDQAATIKETAGGKTRTRTTTFDGAGRPLTTSETSPVDTPLPAVTDKYNTTNGSIETQSTPEGKTLTTTYDTLGHLVSYKDADGNTATFEYETEGAYRLKQMTDGKGWQTYFYDSTTGLLSELIDSGAGAFKTTRDVEGRLTSVYYPNAMTAYTTYNAVGAPSSLEYKKITHCTEKCTWYSETVTPGINGEAQKQVSSLVEEANYTYDAAGRLTQTQETPAGGHCETRLYAYDEDGNRVSTTQRPPNSEGKCATEGGTTQWRTYDTGDHSTDPGTVYEAFGNPTTLPSQDAGEHAITSSYYINGQLVKQTQGEQTNEYKLDPAGRTRETIKTGTTSGTVISHYDAPGDGLTWTSEGTEKWSRNVPGPEGGLIAIQTNTGTVLELHDLSGNIVATAKKSETETSLLSTYRSTEFGVPSTKEAPPTFGWAGASGLSAEGTSGTVTRDGITYVPQTGEPLQTSGVELLSPTNVAVPFANIESGWVNESAIAASGRLVAQAEEAARAAGGDGEAVEAPPVEEFAPCVGCATAAGLPTLKPLSLRQEGCHLHAEIHLEGSRGFMLSGELSCNGNVARLRVDLCLAVFGERETEKYITTECLKENGHNYYEEEDVSGRPVKEAVYTCSNKQNYAAYVWGQVKDFGRPWSGGMGLRSYKKNNPLCGFSVPDASGGGE